MRSKHYLCVSFAVYNEQESHKNILKSSSFKWEKMLKKATDTSKTCRGCFHSWADNLLHYDNCIKDCNRKDVYHTKQKITELIIGIISKYRNDMIKCILM